MWDKVAYGGDGKGGYKKMAKDCIDPSSIAYHALPKRKILKATCEHYSYGVAKVDGVLYQVAPYYHMGRLAAQHLRDAEKNFKWRGKAQKLEMFGQRLFPAGSNRRIVITEGEIDCLSIAQMLSLKTPVVSIPSGTGSAKQSIMDNLEYLNSFDEVILAFDNDEPGIKARDEVVTLFKPGTVKLFQYPEGVKDCNELLQEGKGQLILDGVFKAQAYRPDGIVAGYDLWDAFMAPPEPGYDTPYPVLNKKFRGLRKKALYLFTAGSGIGKSTLVKEIGYHFLMHHKLKVGVVALEESKSETAEAFVGIHLNRNLREGREGLTVEHLHEAFFQTVGNERFWLYDHFGSMDLDGLISKLRYMAVGLGVDWIILDHISIVVSGLDEIGESERKMIDKLMTKLRSLIEETGVGVLAIVHLKRREDKGKSFNEGAQVRLTDLRGSGGLEQVSDGVIAMERDQQGENTNKSLIRVLKNRKFGHTGPADNLIYDPATGRLTVDESAGFGFKSEHDGISAF